MFLELIFIFAAAFYVARKAQNWQARRGGRKLREDLDAAFSSGHEFVSVSADDYRDLDLQFYAQRLHEMEQEGFGWVDDVEDLTLSRQFPGNRTFQRILVTPDGKMRASIYHLKPRGLLYRILTTLRLVPKEYYTVELATEFSGGYTLVTNNTKGVPILDMPPQLDILVVAPDTTTSEIVNLHLRRVEHFLEQKPEEEFYPAVSREQILSAVQRILIMCERFRKERGYTMEELERVSPGIGNKSSLQQLHRELNRSVEG